jgi:hypothetical protein
MRRTAGSAAGVELDVGAMVCGADSGADCSDKAIMASLLVRGVKSQGCLASIGAWESLSLLGDLNPSRLSGSLKAPLPRVGAFDAIAENEPRRLRGVAHFPSA